jgi:hypothetical protein
MVRAVKTVDEDAEISCLVGRGKLRERSGRMRPGKLCVTT